jgi:uncharacterized repeat protein (TIGR01451 family)
VSLSAEGDTNPANDADEVTTQVVCRPDLEIDKRADVESVAFGGTVTYGVAVRHTAASDPLAIGVQEVSDALGAATPVALVPTGGDTDGDQLLDKGETWTYGVSAGEGTAPFTATATGCGPLVNTVTLTAEGDTDPANNTDSVTTPVICTLDVGIAKSAANASSTPGETIVYTITVTNNGQAAIPFGQIEVTDAMLADLAPVNPPAVLESGQSVDFTGTRAVTIADCGQIVNTASVRLVVDGRQVAEVDATNNQASATVPVACTMDVAIAKQADKAAYAPGETITYQVTVTNAGQLPIPFGAIQVSDPTLPGLALVGPAPETLAPRASLVYAGTRAVTVADCGQVPNTATVALVGDLQAEVTTANNSAAVTVTVAGQACEPVVVGDPDTTLRIVKSGPRSSQVRRGVPYVIRVTNSGTVTAKNVVLVDPIPAGMRLVRLPVGATVVKGKVRWAIGDLAVGQTKRFTVMMRTDVNATRTRCNVATASAANAPSVRGRACTRFVRIAGAPRVPVVTG